MSQILRLPKVVEKSGFQKSTIYKKVSNGTFPAPIPIGSRAVGWLEHEIDEWIADRVAASRDAA